MKAEGSALTGGGGATGRPLPRPSEGIRAAHKPWCADCKRTKEPAQLDRDGRCESCARAAVSRAAAAERRAEREAEDRAAASAAQRKPAAAPKPATRSSGDADGQVLQLVDVDQLHPDPNNVREDLGDLTELARSIRDVGILQPIVARRQGGRLMIVMGHRRHEAARVAGVDQVPVIVRAGDMDPDDVLAAMIVENGQRLGLDPIEEARALSRLKRADQATDADLADRISKSQPYVSGRLALLSLTPQQQAAVRAGTLSLARAVRLGRDQGGVTRPAAAGKKSAAHLDWHHPLAEKASILCTHNGHSKHMPGRPGGVACGHCWEATIRADERERLTKKETA